MANHICPGCWSNPCICDDDGFDDEEEDDEK